MEKDNREIRNGLSQHQAEGVFKKKGMNGPKGYFWNNGNVLKLDFGNDCRIL